jgi:prevent-host-death family protein
MQHVLPQTVSGAWRLQDAKAQFSALVDSAMRGVPQHVTRRGKQAVVVVSAQDFEALQHHAANRVTPPSSFIAHLLAIPKESPKTPGKAKSQARKTVDLPALDLQPREIDLS